MKWNKIVLNLGKKRLIFICIHIWLETSQMATHDLGSGTTHTLSRVHNQNHLNYKRVDYHLKISALKGL